MSLNPDEFFDAFRAEIDERNEELADRQPPLTDAELAVIDERLAFEQWVDDYERYFNWCERMESGPAFGHPAYQVAS